MIGNEEGYMLSLVLQLDFVNLSPKSSQTRPSCKLYLNKALDKNRASVRRQTLNSALNYEKMSTKQKSEGKTVKAGN